MKVIANCDHLEKLKFSRTNPYAFSEHGTIMLASVLNTPIAIQTSVLIVRAFVKLREILSANKELERKLFDLESRLHKCLALSDFENMTALNTLIKRIWIVLYKRKNLRRNIHANC